MMNQNKIEENNEAFQDEYRQIMKEYLEKAKMNPTVNLKNDIDEEGGKVITPNPYCVLKTFDKNKQKIFINITSHDLIEPPKEENILELNNQFGVRIPLSLSEKLEDFDNKMGICQVYDVIISTKVVTKCQNEPLVLGFLYSLIVSRVNEKYKHQLSEEFKQMKNLKYKGKTVRSQRVRVRKGPKIEEVLENSNNQTKFNISKQNFEASRKIPEWNFFILGKSLRKYKETQKLITVGEIQNILKNSNDLLVNKVSDSLSQCIITFDGYNSSPRYGKGFLFLVSLPLMSKNFGMSLDISNEGFIFNCGKIYTLSLKFPYLADSKQSISMFDSISKTMLILIPFENEDIEEKEKLAEKESQNKLFVSTPKLTDNYLYDVI